MTRNQEWSIQEVARATGTTSRTLRHYDAEGLLPPSRVGSNGYRFYDEAALLRLQRILLLRELGLGLPAIAQALDADADQRRALTGHLRWLESERRRIADQIDSVRSTITTLERGRPLMADNMFRGFDHTQYRGEVEERWGKDSSLAGDRWWSTMTAESKDAFLGEQRAIAEGFAAARAAGEPADGDAAQGLARRQHAWLTVSARGTGQPDITSEYFTGLADMYVADPRFTAAYDWAGEGTAVYVRDAMHAFAERNL